MAVDDEIQEISFPSYPKAVLLNAFFDKPEDTTYRKVKSNWKAILTDSRFCGCEVALPALPGKSHFFTITKSVRHSDTWQFTSHDEKGPIMHEDYSDINEDAGHSIRPITYSADFKYEQDGTVTIEDVKGFDRNTGKWLTTQVFNLKWKLLKARYPQFKFVLF